MTRPAHPHRRESDPATMLGLVLIGMLALCVGVMLIVAGIVR